MIAVNKADGAMRQEALQARAAYERALSILQPAHDWRAPALTCSATTGEGLDEIWEQVRTHRRQAIESGEHVARRERQRVKWFRASVEQRLLESLRDGGEIEASVAEAERAVREGTVTVTQASERVIDVWRSTRHA